MYSNIWQDVEIQTRDATNTTELHQIPKALSTIVAYIRYGKDLHVCVCV